MGRAVRPTGGSCAEVRQAVHRRQHDHHGAGRLCCRDMQECEDPQASGWLAAQVAFELYSGTKASLSSTDRETLLLMELGERTAAIAAARGVTVRAAQQSMVRIRRAFDVALGEE